MRPSPLLSGGMRGAMGGGGRRPSSRALLFAVDFPRTLTSGVNLSRTLPIETKRGLTSGVRFLTSSPLVDHREKTTTTTLSPPQPPPSLSDQKPTTVDEDAIDRRVWPIALSSMLTGMGVGVVMPVLPIFAKEMGLTPSDFGMVVSVIGMTRLIFNVPAAWTTERYGRRVTLIGGPLLSAFAMALTATARNFHELVAYRFLTGVGGAFQMTGAQLYLSDISTSKNRARTNAPMGMAFGIGAVAGPALGGYLADTVGIGAPFYFVAGAVTLVSLSNYIMLPETRTHISSTRRPILEEWRATASQWKPIMRDKNIRAVLILHGVYWSVASGCMWTLLPLVAHEGFQLSTSSLGGLFALMSGVGILGMYPSAWVSDKLGRKKSIVPASLLLAGSLCAMPWAATHSQLLGLVTVYAMGATMFQATPQSYVIDASAPESRAQALALLRSAGDLGLMVGASSFGLLAHSSNTSTAFALASAALLASGTHFVRTAKEVTGVGAATSSSLPSSSGGEKPR